MPLIYTSNLGAYKSLGYVNLVQTIIALMILLIGLFTTKFIGL